MANDRSLTYFDTIRLEHGPDNIEYDPECNCLYAGVLGRISEYTNIVKELRKYKGERPENFKYWGGVLKIDPKTKKIETLLMQNDLIYGISSGYVFKDKLYVGSWGDTGMLICDAFSENEYNKKDKKSKKHDEGDEKEKKQKKKENKDKEKKDKERKEKEKKDKEKKEKTEKTEKKKKEKDKKEKKKKE